VGVKLCRTSCSEQNWKSAFVLLSVFVNVTCLLLLLLLFLFCLLNNLLLKYAYCIC
jgi:hypothetical protein